MSATMQRARTGAHESSSTSSNVFKRHPVLTYFALTFTISTSGVLFVLAREGTPLDVQESALLGILLFAGPSIAGPLLTGLFDGRAGLRELGARLRKWAVGRRWYAVAILTPLLSLPILLSLSLISDDFLPEITTTDDVAGLLATGLIAGLMGDSWRSWVGQDSRSPG